MLRQVSLALETESELQEVAKLHKARIRVLDCKNLDKSDMAFLLEISSPAGDVESVIQDLKSRNGFKRIYDGRTEVNRQRACTSRS